MKAISLLSGGLDSTLAVKMIKGQGIEVLAVNFSSPFCLCGGRPKQGCRHKAVEMAEQLGVKLKIVSTGERFIEAVKNPKYGYGSAMNPCIDCRILKFKAAKEIMEQEGASFIVTGEVLGQRPMSQNSRAMKLIEAESGLDGYIVRPLCAKNLAPSIPEQRGWVDREKFHAITGRSRQEQLKLVEELKVENHACPAGGCLLTDKAYGAKARDLIDSGMFDMKNASLFRYGRYFPVSADFKIAAGRNENENEILERMASQGDLIVKAAGKGPVLVGRGRVSEEMTEAALKIAAYYTKPGLDGAVTLKHSVLNSEYREHVTFERTSEAEIESFKKHL